MSGYSIVTTTTNSQESAEIIITAVMEKKLAACVQVFPVVSHYVWKDKLQSDNEVLLQMKIKTADYDALAQAIRDVHPYDTPEIMRVEIAQGDPAYLKWIEAATSAAK